KSISFNPSAVSRLVPDRKCPYPVRRVPPEACLLHLVNHRRLDQALNAKEFAVCAGVSYSTARSWFHLPGFPIFHGVTFWQDFVQWRTNHNGLVNPPESTPLPNGVQTTDCLPPRATSILLESR